MKKAFTIVVNGVVPVARCVNVNIAWKINLNTIKRVYLSKKRRKSDIFLEKKNFKFKFFSIFFVVIVERPMFQRRNLMRRNNKLDMLEIEALFFEKKNSFIIQF